MPIYKAKKRISPIEINQKIDYKEINLLKVFITEHGKILSRRATNLTVKQQKQLNDLMIYLKNQHQKKIKEIY